MALIKCRECGHDVSTRASKCPGCGAALREKFPLVTGLLGLAVVAWMVSKCVATSELAAEPEPQVSATATGGPPTLRVMQTQPESLRAECSSKSAPDQFMVNTARVAIDDGTTHDVVLTPCPTNGLPRYCGKGWAHGEILKRIRTPLSGETLVADPTGCWAAIDGQIRFMYFDIETAATVREFSFPATQLRTSVYEWRTGRLLKATGAAAETSTLSATQPTKARMSEAEFDSQFKCPETYASDDESKRGFAEMVDWYASHHSGVTAADLVAYRMELLKRHDCVETLANIEASRKAGAAASSTQ